MKINKRGFTLIELLVVIAIIGILAGIVLVSLSGVRDKANAASLESTMASATTIAHLCVMESGTVGEFDAATPDPICSTGQIAGDWVAPSTGTITTYDNAATITEIRGNIGTDYYFMCDINEGTCCSSTSAYVCKIKYLT